MKIEKLKLTSLNPSEYPDTFVDCAVIDNMEEFTKEYIKYKERKGDMVQSAKKTALVKARLGVVGEQVDTRPRVERDGHIYVIGETKGTVKVEGSMIVNNPDGEEYIVKPEAFAKKYKATEVEGVYEPLGAPIQYITLEDDICFNAPWGELMFAVKGSALNVTSLSDVYAIQNYAFATTYSTIEPEPEQVVDNNGQQEM